jgi:hypothetical protein
LWIENGDVSVCGVLSIKSTIQDQQSTTTHQSKILQSSIIPALSVFGTPVPAIEQNHSKIAGIL